MSVITSIVRMVLKVKFTTNYKFNFTYDDFDPKRSEPYILILNHTQLNDPLFISMNLKYYLYPVASNLLYTNKYMKFGLTRVIKSIPKRKGQSDSKTIRMILEAFNKDHRGILVAPEGNSSFYGEQTPTDYISTAKLVKKLNKDLIIGKIDGGYFAHPRWGKLRKGANIEITYRPLIKAGAFAQYTLEEIAKIMEDAISFNDYQWIEKRDYIYKNKDLAEGIENIIYACPKCGRIQTIESKHNDVYCTHCGKIASFDEKQHLTGQYSTLIDWNIYQKKLLKKHLNDSFQTTGKLYILDLINSNRNFKGDYEIKLFKNELIITNEAHQFIFD
ncbi:MAG: 1-acyl-sn-glycerol-3-phosphate acyltransferase, partial [Acholeplasmataceae bacterium]